MRSSHLLLSTLAAFALATGSAHAADLPATEAEAVADELGTKAAGTYYDAASDQMVVNVTDQNAAKKVRAAGGIAKIVEHSAPSSRRSRPRSTPRPTSPAWPGRSTRSRTRSS